MRLRIFGRLPLAKRGKKRYGRVVSIDPATVICADGRPDPSLSGMSVVVPPEGQYLGSRRKAGMVVSFVTAQCACKGENESCFRCGGSGSYIREMVEEMRDPSPVSPLRGRRQEAKQESTFSNDPRGNIRGVREIGRFGSNPHYEEDT